jgi:hypothetical protein
MGVSRWVVAFIVLFALAVFVLAAVSQVQKFYPSASTDANSIATNDANVYDKNEATNATVDVGASTTRRYFVLTTFSITGYSSASTIASLNMTYLVTVQGTSNDLWGLQYSTNGGSTWADCRAAATGNTAKANFSCSIAVSGWTLNNVSQLLQARIATERSGPNDNARLYAYEVWAAVNFTVPNVAPVEASRTKNESVVYQNMYVLFNSTWTDSDSVGLDKFIFSTNASGSWQNFSNLPFMSGGIANYTMQITAATDAAVGWVFYANDTDGGMTQGSMQSFVVVSGSDTTNPAVSNERVNSSSGSSGSVFNISARMTDAGGISNAYAEIFFPGGSRTNYSMAQGNSTHWWYNHTGLPGGNYSAKMHARDPTGNWNSSGFVYFNVTANTVIQGFFFIRGDSLVFNGTGFSANGNVDVHIHDSEGLFAVGYPLTVQAGSDGNFSHAWSIPSGQSTVLDNYTIEALDQGKAWLNGSNEFRIILKANTATRVDRQGTASVLSQVNDSDASVARIVSLGTEDYIELEFNNTIPASYNLDQIRFAVEHQEVSSNAIRVRVFDNGAWTTVCTLPISTAAYLLDECDLSSVVNTNSEARNIRIRMSDDNTVGNNIQWTDVSFVFLHVRATPVEPPFGVSVAFQSPALLSAGAYTSIECNSSFNFSIGGGNITGVSAQFFVTGLGEGSSVDNSTHYVNSSCAPISVAGYYANFSCVFRVAYWALNGSWTCNATATTNAEVNGSKSFAGVVDPLFAFDMSSLWVDYGNLSVGETSIEKSLSLQNVGNQNLSMDSYGFGGFVEGIGTGYSFLCPNWNITIGNERYSQSSGVSWSAMTPLTSVPGTDLGLVVPKQINETNVTRSLYWLLYVEPTAQAAPKGVTCNGTINFDGTPI